MLVCGPGAAGGVVVVETVAGDDVALLGQGQSELQGEFVARKLHGPIRDADRLFEPPCDAAKHVAIPPRERKEVDRAAHAVVQPKARTVVLGVLLAVGLAVHQVQGLSEDDALVRRLDHELVADVQRGHARVATGADIADVPGELRLRSVVLRLRGTHAEGRCGEQQSESQGGSGHASSM